MTVQTYVEKALSSTRLPYNVIAERARKRLGSETTPASVRSMAAEMRRARRRVLKRPRGH